MVAKQELLEKTKVDQQQEFENMQLLKQKKAEKILKQRRQREIANAWI